MAELRSSEPPSMPSIGGPADIESNLANATPEDLVRLVKKQQVFIQRQQQRFVDLLKLHRKNQSDRETVERQQEQIDDLNEEIATTKAQLEECRTRLSELQEDYNSGQSELSELKSTLAELEASNGVLKRALSQSKLEYDVLKTRTDVALEYQKSSNDSLPSSDPPSPLLAHSAHSSSNSKVAILESISAWEDSENSLRNQFSVIREEFEASRQKLKEKYEIELKAETERADKALRLLREAHSEANQTSVEANAVKKRIAETQEKYEAEMARKNEIIASLNKEMDNLRMTIAEEKSNTTTTTTTNTNPSPPRTPSLQQQPNPLPASHPHPPQNPISEQDATNSFLELAMMQASRDGDLAQLREKVASLQSALEESERTEKLRDTQTRVLKEEIAEMRRNADRSTVDLGYLKEIVLRYLNLDFKSPTVSEEQKSLVTVLTKLLSFSDVEQKSVLRTLNSGGVKGSSTWWKW